MAIAIDDPVTSVAGAETRNTVTWQHAVSGANRLLLVGMATVPGTITAPSTVTFHGVSMDAVGTIQRFMSDIFAVELFSLVAPDTGTWDIVVTCSEAVTSIGGGAISFTGVDQTTPLGTPGGTVGTADPVQVTGIASATDELVVDVAACVYAATALTKDASQTEQFQTYFSNSGDGGQQRKRVGMSTKPGAASVTMSWTGQNGDGWGIVAVSVKPAAASSVTWLRHRA